MNANLEATLDEFKLEYEESLKRTYASVDRDDDLPENN